jgi:importin subunit alpha-6/7
VMEAGALPIFVRLLMSPNDDVRVHAVWALGIIAGASPPCRDLVLQAGAMQPLLNQLNQNSKISMLRKATWTLSHVCRGTPRPDFELVRPSLPTHSREPGLFSG